MIELRHITKTYGKKHNQFKALNDINLTIPGGASVAILGKSGSGKSTLMHAISGLDRPQTGQVVIGGRDILQMKPRQVDAFRARTISFIFQSFFVEGNDSVVSNVMLPLEIAGVPRAQRSAKVNQALEAVGLASKKPRIYLVGRSSAWRLPEQSWASRRSCLLMSQLATWIARRVPRSRSCSFASSVSTAQH